MKFSSIIVGACAAVATATPLKARQSIDDLSQLNNLQIVAQPLEYILAISGLSTSFDGISGLVQNQNLDLNEFSNIFSDDTFDVQSLAQLQQLLLIEQLAQQQLFEGVDLTNLDLTPINFGLLQSGIQGVDLGDLVTSELQPQLAEVISQNVVAKN